MNYEERWASSTNCVSYELHICNTVLHLTLVYQLNHCLWPVCSSLSLVFIIWNMDTSKKTDPPVSVESIQQKVNPERSPIPSIYVPEQGGYKEKFVNAVEDKYKCEKCHLILCNPRQTECGHRYCETCMTALLRLVFLGIVVFKRTKEFNEITMDFITYNASSGLISEIYSPIQS